MYKVLIVDDEIMIRRGLSKIIHWEEIGFEMAGAVGNAMEALELIKKTPVACPFNRHQHAGDDRTGTDPSGKKDIAGVKDSGDQRVQRV
mgnify:CR=1 FL=1